MDYRGTEMSERGSGTPLVGGESWGYKNLKRAGGPEDEDDVIAYGDNALRNRLAMGAAYALLLTMGLIASLVVAGIALHRVNSIETGSDFAAVCNAGSNLGLLLPGCPDPAAVPGLNLVYGNASQPDIAFVRRISKGAGVNLTSFPDEHIEVGVIIESLSP